MVTQHLVEQWRRRLADWQRRLDEGRPRPWLALAYLRVLSFLLAQYGAIADADSAVNITAPAAETKPAIPRDSPSIKVSVAAHLVGKPPRTGTQIRSVLEAVQANVPHAEQGPQIAGARPDDPIVIAAFYSMAEVGRLLRMLEAAGIKWQTQFFRRRTQVVVRMADLERAKLIVAQHSVDVHDSQGWRRDTVEDFSRRSARASFEIGLWLMMFLEMSLFGFILVNGKTSEKVAYLIAAMAFVVVPAAVGAIGRVLGFVTGKIITRDPRRYMEAPTDRKHEAA